LKVFLLTLLLAFELLFVYRKQESLEW